MLTMKFLQRRRKLIVGFGYVLFLFIFAAIATALLWQYRAIANDVIWMFLGIFSIMSIFFGLFFYIAFGRTAPDVQM